jgi:hypothetical protein
MPGTREPSRYRFLLTPRWLAWHVLMVVSVVGMLALGDWQLHRAESGNGLSWAYTFEWPIFAIFAVVFWAKTIRDEVRPHVAGAGVGDVDLPAGARGPGGSGADERQDDPGDAREDEELSAYNAYLARLHREVKGHGKWHGLR